MLGRIRRGRALPSRPLREHRGSRGRARFREKNAPLRSKTREILFKLSISVSRKLRKSFAGGFVPTCRPRGVKLEVEPARSRVPAHAPQDHRPLAPGAVPVPRASRASPVVASSEVLVGSWPARFRFRLTPQGAVPSSPATRAQSGPRRLTASCLCPCLIAPFALRLGFFLSEPPAVGPLPPSARCIEASSSPSMALSPLSSSAPCVSLFALRSPPLAPPRPSASRTPSCPRFVSPPLSPTHMTHSTGSPTSLC